MGGPIGRNLAAHYGAMKPCDMSFSVAGGGAFIYFGLGAHPGPFAAELLGVISYDSQTGGQHGGVLAGGVGNYTAGIEALRTWNNWQETISPIGFSNGVAAIVPKSIGPVTVTEANYGGLLELDNGELQIGGYLGGANSAGRAAGIGGYLSLTATSTCGCQAQSGK
jgi:hypothetical protein